MLKKILILALMLLLLVSDANALGWQETFEGHPDDLGNSRYVLSSFTVDPNGKGYWISNGNGGSVTFNSPFENYLGFTINTYQADSYAGANIKLTIKNSSNVIGLDSTFNINNNQNNNDVTRRIEVEENAAGTGVNVYSNGVLLTTLMYSSALAVDKTGTLQISVSRTSGYDLITRIDNVVSFSGGVVGCDNTVGTVDTAQYFTFGFPYLTDSYWYYQVNSPSNIVLKTENITLSNFNAEKNISKTLLTEAGDYKVKLYRHVNSSGSNILYGTRTFNYVTLTTSLNRLSVTPSETKTGNMIKISSMVTPFKSGYTIRIVSAGSLIKTYNITDDTEDFYYTIPTTVKENYIFVYLVDPNGNAEITASVKVINNDIATELSLDKKAYTSADTIRAFYVGVPIGAKLSINFYKSGKNKFSYIETINDVVGYKYYTINGTDADYALIEIYDDSTKKVYASASASILPLSYSYRVFGTVYDAESGAPIDGVMLKSNNFTVITDETGKYNTSTFAGNNLISISKTGYKTENVSCYVNAPNTQRDFYLSPTFTSITGHSIYGMVTDYYTGAAINNAKVTVKAGASTLSEFTHNGQYVFDSSAINGNITITVNAEGYSTFSKVVTVSGDYYYDIKLVPASGVPEIEDPSSGIDDKDVDNTNYSAQPYGAYGRHPFDFDGDGKVSGEEWRYAVEHLSVALGCLMFMGFLSIVGRAGRR